MPKNMVDTIPLRKVDKVKKSTKGLRMGIMNMTRLENAPKVQGVQRESCTLHLLARVCGL